MLPIKDDGKSCLELPFLKDKPVAECAEIISKLSLSDAKETKAVVPLKIPSFFNVLTTVNPCDLKSSGFELFTLK